MPWSFDPSAWTTATKPSVANFQSIAADLHTLGANKDAAHYGLSNAAFATLVPQELPGTSYSVTAGSWAAGTATLTIGAHNIQAGQLIVVSSVTPSGYNNGGAEAAVTAITGTQVSYALASNPGVWTSGGSVAAWGTAANGMLAVDASGNLNFRQSGSFSKLAGAVSTPTAWAAPTLLNSWTNLGGVNATAAYMIDSFGVVRVRGVLHNGTNTDGTIIFNLPTGFRPPLNVSSPAINGTTNGAIRVIITSGGDVTIYNASGAVIIDLNFSFSTT